MTDDLNTAIATLMAEREIKDALFRYQQGQDRRLPDVQRSAFHADAWVDAGAIKGDADSFVRQAQALLNQFARTHHQMGQIRIDLNGDDATGEVYFTAYHRIEDDGPPEDLFIAGRYIDTYCRRDGSWRIVHRIEAVDWTRRVPAADAET